MSKPETLTDIQVALGDLSKHFEFIKKGPSLSAVKPKHFLTTGTYGKVARILVDGFGGKWISVGKESHFEVPLAEKKKEVAEGQKTLPAQPEFQVVPVDAILSMPFQSRLEFDEAGIGELAESIKVHGVLEPLLVRPRPEGLYQLVAGERRLRAAKKAGLTVVPCLVRKLSDQEAFEVHLIENDQRQDLSDYGRGRMYSEMLRQFPEAYPTQEALAKKVGRTKQYVSYHIQHYEFVEETKAKVPTSLSTRVDKLPERTTREIRQAPPEVQAKITGKVVEKEFSARETRQLVDTVAGTEKDNWDTILAEEAELAKKRKEEREKPVKPVDHETKGKLCPVCGRVINEELYEKLKDKFAPFRGLFK